MTSHGPALLQQARTWGAGGTLLALAGGLAAWKIPGAGALAFRALPSGAPEAKG